MVLWKKKLVIGYCSVLVLLILFPPWDSNTPGLDFIGYNFIVPFIKTKYVWYAYSNIHVPFLLIEILVVTLIFGSIFYLNKDKMK